MDALLAAATSTALVPAIIAAAASIICAGMVGWVALRAQSATQQLEQITKIADQFADKIIEALTLELREVLKAETRGLVFADIVRRTLREVLLELPREHRRRHYDPEDD